MWYMYVCMYVCKATKIPPEFKDVLVSRILSYPGLRTLQVVVYKLNPQNRGGYIIVLEQLVNELSEKNSYSVKSKYLNFFKNQRSIFPVKIIQEGAEFYRARIGFNSIKGSVDDFDTDIIFPYFRDELGASPPFKTKGGRFNKEGTSFLYLGTDEKTCIAELRAEVNQPCSVGKFKVKRELQSFDLSPTKNEELLVELQKLMLEPIHNGNKHLYLVSQFISDILRELGFDGIYYKSTITNGENIVGFNPLDFEFQDFSEKLYQAKKIEYTICEVPDSLVKYKRKPHLLNAYNAREEEKKEVYIDYLLDKYNVYVDTMLNSYLDNIKKKQNFNEKIEICNKMVEEHKQNTWFSQRVFSIRGDLFKYNGNFDEAIKDYYRALTYTRGTSRKGKDIVNIILDNIGEKTGYDNEELKSLVENTLKTIKKEDKKEWKELLRELTKLSKTK
jgi:hypothetical protein